MADRSIEFQLAGLSETLKQLKDFPILVRDRMLYKALRAGGLVVRNAAVGEAPIGPRVVRGGRVIRLPGTLRNAIAVRKSKVDFAAGNVGVFVNVRPAKGLNRGGLNPNDPFYWRWVNFGSKTTRAVHFLEAAISTMGSNGPALAEIEGSLSKQIQAYQGATR